MKHLFNEQYTTLGTHITKSQDETIELGFMFASSLKENDIVVFSGDLGVGKTRFISGIAKHFNVDKKLSSPTFTIVNEYHMPYPVTQNNSDISCLYHFDVYRLKNSEDFENTVGSFYFTQPNSISVIEWGDIISDILPNNTIYILIERIDDNTRKIQIKRLEKKHEQ